MLPSDPYCVPVAAPVLASVDGTTSPGLVPLMRLAESVRGWRTWPVLGSHAGARVTEPVTSIVAGMAAGADPETCPHLRHR
jgi:hypothetical protein